MPDSEAQFNERSQRRLSHDLRALYAAPPVPASVDEEILRALEPAPARRRPWVLGTGAAAAAVLLITGILAWFGPPPTIDEQRKLAHDVDGNQRLDIVDAYLVAVAAERGDAPLSWDVNGDGNVDVLDATVLAQRVVRLPL
ncbi:MAG: dockerin type I repeat-containing protein [Planctomycetota bacterium]